MNSKARSALRKAVKTVLMGVVFYALFAGLVLVAEGLASVI